ncbi:MAG: hypothetical protein RJA63_2265 [Pseudomonadota bacterium]|jgi:hypothetical protein
MGIVSPGIFSGMQGAPRARGSYGWVGGLSARFLLVIMTRIQEHESMRFKGICSIR